MRWRLWLGFAGLCLLSGSAWLLDEVAKPIFSGPAHVAVHYGLLAVVFGLVSLKPGRRARTSGRILFRVALAGVLLFGLPIIMNSAAAGKVSGLDGVLVFCLVPAMVVFLSAQSVSGFGESESPLRLLLPALAGLGGAALILPFTLPPRMAGKLWLLGIVVSAMLSAWAAIQLHPILQGVNLFRALAILCASAAGSCWLFTHHGIAPVGVPSGRQLIQEAARVLLLDAPVLLLVVSLLRRLNPVAFSVRLLLIPLVTIIESYLIERPQVGWTTLAGALLMASGAFVLLLAQEPGDAQVASLRRGEGTIH